MIFLSTMARNIKHAVASAFNCSQQSKDHDTVADNLGEIIQGVFGAR